jgi:uncharacterized protein YuzE
MSGSFLEVTFRNGKPFAAYLRLRRAEGGRVHHTRELRPGLLVDFAADGTALGVEIVHPAETDEDAVMAVLAECKALPVARAELAPLRAA